jgi:metal-dependent hydrolase (beta-lactamase superfamily II)
VAFELVGVDPADVALVALSHLHNDHAGGLRWTRPGRVARFTAEIGTPGCVARRLM